MSHKDSDPFLGILSHQNLQAQQDQQSEAGSEDLDDQVKEDNRATYRYGNVIDKKSYATGSILRLIVIVVAILIVPI